MKNLTRIPIYPLDYLSKDQAAPKELILDYVGKKIYAKSKDGSSFIGFNEAADTHIADTSVHTTTEQKNAWTQDIANLLAAVNTINNTSLPLKAPLNSPAFTGTPTAPTAASNTNTAQVASTAMVQAAIAAGNAHSVDGVHVDDTQITTAYLWTAAKVKAYVDSLLASNDAMVFKATIGTGGGVTALPTTDYGAGWSYKVITAGTYAGNVCEVGDLIVCVKDYVSGTASNADWTVVQTNLDGAVTSSSTSVTSGHVPIFDGTNGKVIKTSGKALPAGNIVGDTSYGTASVGGVVKSSNLVNRVTINPDGTMIVNTIDATEGGTGKVSIAANSMLYASAANVYSEVTTSAFGRSLLNATSEVMFANLNVDMVDGYHVKGDTNLGSAWGYIPIVKTDGVMEVGKYLDFHSSTNDGKDYTFRFENVSDNDLSSTGRFTAPELRVTDKFNINDKAFIKYNSIDDTIELAFA